MMMDESFQSAEQRYDSARNKRRDKFKQGAAVVMPPLLSLRDFLKDFVPPEYLIDGILQRRFIYSLTGQTGHAKTALALLLAVLVGAPGTTTMLGNHQVEHGHVVYFAGENPDDVRMRLIGMGVDPDAVCISVIPGVFDIATMFHPLTDELGRLGEVALIIIDTSAAYFLGDDEISNTQMGDHARMLRKLTEMPGGPCVLVLCHPIKHVTDPIQLLPRGGGAFLAEMDGNLTVWRRDDLVELHHNKIRGPGFEPMTFRIERVTTMELMDSKRRLIPTVKVALVSEHEAAAQQEKTRNEDDQLLAALAEDSDRSLANLARACDWVWQNGEPAKSKVERVLKRLKAAKLVNHFRGRWELTSAGKKIRSKSSKTDNSRRADFKPIKGKRLQGVECVHCGKAYGEVFRIRNGRVKKGKSDSLHEECAEAWFGGDSAKNDQDG
jgi:AAA domain